MEALLHFLDTTKSGQKFEYVPTSEPVTSASVINIEREVLHICFLGSKAVNVSLFPSVSFFPLYFTFTF